MNTIEETAKLNENLKTQFLSVGSQLGDFFFSAKGNKFELRKISSWEDIEGVLVETFGDIIELSSHIYKNRKHWKYENWIKN